MKRLSRSIIFFVCVPAILIFKETVAQSIINPSDPVVNYNPNSKPIPPGWMEIGKWVRTPNTAVKNRNLTWYNAGGIDRYKAYVFQNISFRVQFPRTYNPTANDGKKYPLIIFFHGKGENATAPLYDASTGLNYDNEYQLIQGPREFDTANQNGSYDGYVIVPQITDAFYQGILDNTLLIVKYMIANNKVDPFHIVVNGLSEGGIACWEMLSSYPTYISSSIPMSSPLGGILYSMTVDNTYIKKIKFTPIWLSNGGKDTNPSPSQVQQVKDSMAKYGSNFRVYTDPASGHSTWYQMWAQRDFWPFVNRSYSSNPWPLFGRSQFWPAEPINATIGINPGFEAYEWRRNNTLITNANGNEIHVTGTGIYDARVKRDGVWSDWSHVPVTIKGNDYRIQAEDWIAMNGVNTEITRDVDGNLNVGWIDNGDWLDYTIAPYLSGAYTLKLRLAAAYTGAKLQIRGSDSSVLATVNVPRTGGYQNWQTVTISLPLSAGVKNIRIKSIATTNFNINWMEFSMAGQSPLPVKFIYFNAQCRGEGVNLQWKTAQEINAERFSVQRSADGINWTEIGTVAAAGQSNQQRTYVFADKTASASNLYRIVEYDFNGQQTISSIVRSNCSVRTELRLYPNPSAGNSTLSINLDRSSDVTIQVVDSKGAVMQQKQVLLPPGNSTIPLDMSNYPGGVYSINLHYNGEMKTIKMIKK